MDTSRYVHSLVISRAVLDDTEAERDEYLQPVPSAPVLVEVRGLVQPRTAREAPDTRSAGSEVSDHVIFLPIDTDLEGADAIIHGTRRYNVTGVRRFEYGTLQHLEVDARLVTSQPVSVTEAGS